MTKYNPILIIACSIFLAVSLYNFTEKTSWKLEKKLTLKDHLQFEDWVVKYNKEYQTPEEINYRKWVFNENAKFVEFMNTDRKEYTFKYGLNKFADLTDEEFKNRYIMKFNSLNMEEFPIYENKKEGLECPKSIDWRREHVVTLPKDNTGCPGASYAFAAAGAIESAISIHLKTCPNSFSAQQIIDCSSDFKNIGCSYGSWAYALQYITNYGIADDYMYPFIGKEGEKCFDDRIRKKNRILTWEGFRVNSRECLESKVAYQPIISSIDATNLRLYDSGIYNGYCTINVNFHILIVGYDEINGNKFWIVKNNWGEDWGENGYFRLERGDQSRGKCGIHLYCGRPIVF